MTLQYAELELPHAVRLFVEHLDSQDRSKKTAYGYQQDLLHFGRYFATVHNGPCYVSDVTREDLEGFLRYLKNEKALEGASRNRIIYCFRSFFKFLHRKGMCDANVAVEIETVKQQRPERVFLTDDEVQEILVNTKSPLIRLVLQTLYYTGMRVSECTGLTMMQVDLDNGVLNVLGKGNKRRVIPISGKLLPLLTEYRRTERNAAESWQRFFATASTGKLSPSYINAELAKAVQKAGIKKHVTAHTLRHSFASALIRNNVDLVRVQKLLGHSSLAVTSVYTHATLEELDLAVNVL